MDPLSSLSSDTDRDRVADAHPAEGRDDQPAANGQTATTATRDALLFIVDLTRAYGALLTRRRE